MARNASFPGREAEGPEGSLGMAGAASADGSTGEHSTSG
jgi:hypothetical protein